MSRLLALRLDDEVLDALQTQADGWGVRVENETPSELFRAIEESGASDGDAAIQGVAIGRIAEPVRTAQRIRMSVPEMAVVLVRPGEECPTLREALRFSPFGARDVECVPSHPVDDAVQAIRGAIERAATRERFRGTVSALNQRLAASLSDGGVRAAVGILGRLLEVAPIGVAVTDPAGVVRDVNPRVVQLLGRSEKELLGRPLWDSLPLPDQVRMRRLLSQLNGDPADQPRDLFQAGTADDPHYLEVSGSRLDTSSGGPGCLVILQDVSDRVELVEELRVSNRRKDEFLAMLGHELRNPLAPIRTATELMRLRGDHGSERERSIIERHVGHLVELVDDLLDVARITRGKLELRRQLVDVSDFVGQAVEMASPLLEERRHQLRLSPTAEPLQVEGDPRRLAQVIANLLTNAAKNTDPGGQITVAVTRRGDDAVISVKDTGRGIEPDLLPHIFDMFVQEKQSLDRSAGGLGLGLAIVRSLVELHGGQVEARSQLGEGSEFIVCLPARAAAPEERAPERKAEERRPERPEAVILVVDDNEDAAVLLAQLVRALGYDSHVAHDAPSALAVAEEVRPDVALLDIGLPVMDGYELGERLRAIEGLEGISLVAVTGYGQDSDRARSASAGFAEHLVKPVTMKALRDALEKIVRTARRG